MGQSPLSDVMCKKLCFVRATMGLLYSFSATLVWQTDEASLKQQYDSAGAF